jgi:hypothetical protein
MVFNSIFISRARIMLNRELRNRLSNEPRHSASAGRRRLGADPRLRQPGGRDLVE